MVERNVIGIAKARKPRFKPTARAVLVPKVVEIGAPRKPKTKATAERKMVITEPKFEIAALHIRGTAPYVQHAFSQKARATMIGIQEEGSQTKKGRKRAPKNFQEVYEGAMHKSKQGWFGIPASAFRKAMISACSLVGFQMTIAKKCLFVESDGLDAEEGTPLVKITKGNPHEHYATARNSNQSTDVRCRPMWDEGWEATVRIRWDADLFSATDVYNLMLRVGLQVGVGEGRADSKNSAGVGWGFFEVVR